MTTPGEERSKREESEIELANAFMVAELLEEEACLRDKARELFNKASELSQVSEECTDVSEFNDQARHMVAAANTARDLAKTIRDKPKTKHDLQKFTDFQRIASQIMVEGTEEIVEATVAIHDAESHHTAKQAGHDIAKKSEEEPKPKPKEKDDCAKGKTKSDTPASMAKNTKKSNKKSDTSAKKTEEKTVWQKTRSYAHKAKEHCASFVGKAKHLAEEGVEETVELVKAVPVVVVKIYKKVADVGSNVVHTVVETCYTMVNKVGVASSAAVAMVSGAMASAQSKLASLWPGEDEEKPAIAAKQPLSITGKPINAQLAQQVKTLPLSPMIQSPKTQSPYETLFPTPVFGSNVATTHQKQLIPAG